MSDHRSYPVFLNLADRSVLIVGGGAVGLRKAEGLVVTGARVTVVSPVFAAALEALGEQGAVRLIRRPYGNSLLTEGDGGQPWRLVFVATEQAAVNEAVQRDAAAAGVLCCRCDDPAASDFSGGAVYQASGVTLAVSTEGSSPALAAGIRDQLQAALDPLLVLWSGLLASWRPEVLAKIADHTTRRVLLRRLAGPEMESVLRRGGEAEAKMCFQRWLEEGISDKAGTGHGH